MLSVDDLGPQWTEQPYTHVKEAGLCGQEEPVAFDGAQKGATGVSFTSSDGGRVLQEILIRVERSTAQSLLREVRRQASLCDEFETTESKITTRHSISPLPAPPAGEDQFAFREVTSDVPVAGTVYTNWAVIVLGNALLVIRHSSFSSENGDWEAIVSRAASRAASIE